MNEFICNVKEFRLLANLTQEELAIKVNIRRETISHLENGRYNPSLKLAFQISEVLEVPIEKLFKFKGIRKEE